MLSPEAVAHRDAQRKLLREYMSGSREEPLIIERHAEYSVEEVLYPTLYSRVRMGVRYLYLQLAAHAPFCAMKIVMYRVLGVKVSSRTCFGPGVMLDPLFPELITLEEDVCLGIGCRLLTHEYTVQNFRMGRVRVGKGTVVGTFAMIRSGVTVGRGVTIGAYSLVNRDVPDGLTVGGVPAKPLKTRQEEGE